MSSVRVAVSFECFGATRADAEYVAAQVVEIVEKVMGSIYHPVDAQRGIRDSRIDTMEVPE